MAIFDHLTSKLVNSTTQMLQNIIFTNMNVFETV